MFTDNYSIVKDVTVSLTEYTVDDNIGGLLTISLPQGCGKLHSVDTITYDDFGDFIISVFTSNPSASTFTDNAAQVIDNADLHKFFAIGLGGSELMIGYFRNYVKVVSNVPTIAPFSTNDSILYVGIQVNDDITFTANIKIKLNFSS